MPYNIGNWHFRGGLGDQLAYGVDEYGEPYPILTGQDYLGNTALVTEDTPWYANLLSQGIATTGNILGGRRGSYSAGYNAAGGVGVQASASPGGVSAGLGLSNNTLLLIGIVAAVFLLGKRR